MLSLPICYRCRKKDHGLPECDGPCPCPIDGRGVVEHAEQGYCPAGKYPFAGLGSVVAWMMWKTGASQRYLRRNKACGCGKRAGWLNRKTAWIFNTARRFRRKVKPQQR